MTLPTKDEIYSLTRKCIAVLDDEASAPYRRGSLLDFTGQALPLVVVPDLHARGYFLEDVLNYTLPADFCDGQLTVREALDAGAVRVVCVGDALHSEMRGRSRWIMAYMEALGGTGAGTAMTEEMTEGLGLLMDVMRLKMKYKALFHFLKGNHENIRNRLGGGDYPFCKFTDEGAMTNEFMRQVYGEDVIDAVGAFEDALPLAVVSPCAVISHAEPMRAFTRDEIINARDDESIVEGLTWTANDQAEDGSVRAVMQELGCDGLYITGHRPVHGKYNLRAGGLLVQIHNPDEEQVALVRSDRKFDPEQDIVRVGHRG